MDWAAQSIAWISDAERQPLALPMAFACYFVVFHYWRSLSPINDVGERLSDVYGQATSGVAKKLLARIRRMMRQADTIGGIVAACLSGLLFRLLIGVTLASLILAITGIALQPFIGGLEVSAAERIRETAKMLGAGLLDALTFDLFSIWGVELRPHFDDIRARVLFFAFYALEAVLIGETLLTLGMNLWTALVCLMLPQPALKLARTGEVRTFWQWLVRTFTTVGAT